MISPIFEKLSDNAEGVDFYKVDIDAAPDVSQEVGIRAVGSHILGRPTILASDRHIKDAHVYTFQERRKGRRACWCEYEGVGGECEHVKSVGPTG